MPSPRRTARSPRPRSQGARAEYLKRNHPPDRDRDGGLAGEAVEARAWGSDRVAGSATMQGAENLIGVFTALYITCYHLAKS